MNTLIAFLLHKYTLILIINAAVSYGMFKYIRCIGEMDTFASDPIWNETERKQLSPNFFENFFAIVAFIIWFGTVFVFFFTIGDWFSLLSRTFF
ncbi:hypothetical protein [Dickeya fangzhongdai]|uniref:hypothetical protein n=1 Tax=Dickeya fangzhongdai TaxID=1778540 RepID=UPI0026E09AFF|nr:hypothetical protein [Dickeya fangzhongdai]WKV52164.1 hypothetical protein PL145_08100 [Dickeya fangzhongdai]